MMIPHIQYKEKTLVYLADFVPSAGHISIPYVMAYDVRPLLTMEEKVPFMLQAAKEEFILFFEHDPVTECCTVEQSEKGIRVKEKFNLAEYFNS